MGDDTSCQKIKGNFILETLRIKGSSRYFATGFGLEKFAEAFHDGLGLDVGFQGEIVEFHRVGGVVVEFHTGLPSAQSL